MTGDFADEGSRLEELAREGALRRHDQIVARESYVMPAVMPARMDCIECGEPIPAARIKARPHTRRCVQCASEVERRG